MRYQFKNLLTVLRRHKDAFVERPRQVRINLGPSRCTKKGQHVLMRFVEPGPQSHGGT